MIAKGTLDLGLGRKGRIINVRRQRVGVALQLQAKENQCENRVNHTKEKNEMTSLLTAVLVKMLTRGLIMSGVQAVVFL
jgi:hypothetical protein